MCETTGKIGTGPTPVSERMYRTIRLKGGLICKPDNLLNEICYEANLKEMIQQGYLSPLVSRAAQRQ